MWQLPRRWPCLPDTACTSETHAQWTLFFYNVCECVHACTYFTVWQALLQVLILVCFYSGNFSVAALTHIFNYCWLNTWALFFKYHCMLDKIWSLLEKGPWLSGSDHGLGNLLNYSVHPRQQGESGLLLIQNQSCKKAIATDLEPGPPQVKWFYPTTSASAEHRLSSTWGILVTVDKQMDNIWTVGIPHSNANQKVNAFWNKQSPRLFTLSPGIKMSSKSAICVWHLRENSSGLWFTCKEDNHEKWSIEH